MEALLVKFDNSEFYCSPISGKDLKDIQKKALADASDNYRDAYLINDYLIGLKPKYGTKKRNEPLFRIITEDLFKSRK